MIPQIQSQQPQSSPRRYVPTHLPFNKLNSLDDFLAIKSNAIVLHSPSPGEEGLKLEEPEIIGQPEQDVKIPESPVFKKPFFSSLTDFLKDRKEILIPPAKKIQASPCRFLGNEDIIYKQRKAQNNYIRFDYGQAMHSSDVYEATDKDLNFISQLNNQFLDGCQASEETIKFTQHQFERLIEKWEHATSDGDIISQDQALLLSREDSTEIDPKIDELHTKVYEYWKELREFYHRPLLRRYLRSVNKDLTNPNIAFLRRKENKFARRRSQRMSSPEEDFKRMKNLKKNIGRGLLLLGNVKYREMLKLEQQEIKIKMFHQQIKEELGEADDFISQVTPSNLAASQGQAYQEARKKMEEEHKKGEIILKSLKRLKEGAIKSVAKSAKRKLSLTQLSSASMSTVTSTDALMTPLTFNENKFSSELPKNIEGSFKLPIQKSLIQLSDLKLRLTQSLGGLSLKNQEEIRVKIDVIDMDKKELVDAVKCEDEAQEELAIKIEIEDDASHKNNSPSTFIRYSICFNEPTQSKTFSFGTEGTEEKTQEQSELSNQSEDLQLDVCVPMSQMSQGNSCLSFANENEEKLPDIYAGNC